MIAAHTEFPQLVEESGAGPGVGPVGAGAGCVEGSPELGGEGVAGGGFVGREVDGGAGEVGGDAVLGG
jgi:hypothetical protein